MAARRSIVGQSRSSTRGAHERCSVICGICLCLGYVERLCSSL
jgi:hypothetical protein